ncbi:hypothetical protein BU16DRAFT_538933 [Lophium mytilinum]|uniref:Uncharacterized protein n=1 Tax=Lophium mytilinum TaxID=390894 RepID=A0A6A6QVC9_9PEZI|nr:hypothetical protein BU16DRAFT_538933 [Lophium mytilinum]
MARPNYTMRYRTRPRPSKPRLQILTKEPRPIAQRCEELAIELANQAGEETPWLLSNLPTSSKSTHGYYNFASEADRETAREYNCNTINDVLKLSTRKQETLTLNIRFFSPDKEADFEGSEEIDFQKLRSTLEDYEYRMQQKPPANARKLVTHAPHLLHGVTLLILLTLIPAEKIIRLAVSQNIELTYEMLQARKREAINELPLYQWEQFLGLREGDFDELADALRKQKTSSLIEDEDEKGKSKVAKKAKGSGKDRRV